MTNTLAKTFDKAVDFPAKLRDIFKKSPKPLTEVSEPFTKTISTKIKIPQTINASRLNSYIETMLRRINFDVANITRLKAATIIGTIGLGALSYITHKHSYKMGQIDQKYTDKAQTQQILNK